MMNKIRFILTDLTFILLITLIWMTGGTLDDEED